MLVLGNDRNNNERKSEFDENLAPGARSKQTRVSLSLGFYSPLGLVTPSTFPLLHTKHIVSLPFYNTSRISNWNIRICCTSNCQPTRQRR